MAGDRGPRAALEPIAAEVMCDFLPTDSADSGTDSYWDAVLRTVGPELLFVGTSESEQGLAIEAAARRAACCLGLRSVCVEDFPGNYRGIAGCRDGLLVADGAFSLDLAVMRHPGAFSGAIALNGLRYDPLRTTRPVKPVPPTGRAIWVGQPETANNLATIELLVPALRASGCELLFRAHPRDAGYSSGAYRELLHAAGSTMDDVSSLSWAECLGRRPSLVLTQYSSLAVEAGFHGIPSVNALFADIGARQLSRTKGYANPPWCEAGAALLISEPREVQSVLSKARDPQSRAAVLGAFVDYFEPAEHQVPRLLYHLYNHALN